MLRELIHRSLVCLQAQRKTIRDAVVRTGTALYRRYFDSTRGRDNLTKVCGTAHTYAVGQGMQNVTGFACNVNIVEWVSANPLSPHPLTATHCFATVCRALTVSPPDLPHCPLII